VTTCDLVVERVEWDDVDDALRVAMLHLGLASRRPCPFFAPEYIDSYLKHNERYDRRETEPFVLLVRRVNDGRPGELIGALPLKRIRNSDRGGYHQIEFVVATEVDLPTPIAAPEHEVDVTEALVPVLAELLRHSSAVHLINQPEGAPLCAAVRAGVPWYTRVQEYPGMPISGIAIRHASVADYFSELSKRMRSNISRLGRRLAAEGEVELLTSSDPASLDDLFTVYLDIEDRSWKRKTEASLRRSTERLEMYETLFENSAAVGYHIDVILLDGVPVAGLVSIRFGPTLFLMETCYDERHAAFSPSNLLILLSVDRAIRGGCRHMSLHGHFDYYKHRWLAEQVETCQIRLVRRGSSPDIRSVAGNVRRKFAGDDEEHGTPQGQRENEAPVPQSAVAQLVEKLRASPDVERYDAPALAERLPFDMSSPT